MAINKNYFRDRAQQIEYRYEQAKANQLESKVDLKTDFANMEAQLRRANAPPTSPVICPECWIIHNRESILYAVPHDDPKHYDRWKCPKCEFVVDVKIGMP